MRKEALLGLYLKNPVTPVKTQPFPTIRANSRIRVKPGVSRRVNPVNTQPQFLQIRVKPVRND